MSTVILPLLRLDDLAVWHHRGKLRGGTGIENRGSRIYLIASWRHRAGYIGQTNNLQRRLCDHAGYRTSLYHGMRRIGVYPSQLDVYSAQNPYRYPYMDYQWSCWAERWACAYAQEGGFFTLWNEDKDFPIWGPKPETPEALAYFGHQMEVAS